MNLLFIHQNFPGQFKHLAPALANAGHDVRALAIDGAGLPQSSAPAAASPDSTAASMVAGR